MKVSRALTIIPVLIIVLSLVAAGLGVFSQGGGSHYDFQTLRGQTISVQGTGLYRFDSTNAASQAMSQDVVTLCVGIPLLIAGTLWCRRGSLRGRLLLTGTLGYFLYTYTSISFMSAYNQLFLVYVALMSLSLFGVILAVSSIAVNDLPAHFSASFPRRLVAGFMIFIGVTVAMMWMGLLAPTLSGEAVPAGLDVYSTMVIQALDLGIIVPLAFLAGILLWSKKPWGYVLASVMLIKGTTMGLALVAMGIGQMRAGVEVSPALFGPFVLIAVLNLVMTAILFRNVSDRATAAHRSLRFHGQGAARVRP